MEPMTDTMAATEGQVAEFRTCFEHVRREVGRVFVGQPALIDHLLICFFCQGHALIEGAPGLGKTLLVRTLSQAVALTFARVQCTPDLMPADITGTNLLLESPTGVRSFAFQRGPLFANVVLADEINRATPRTQAAFLEAMQERHVTVFGVSHPIPAPFSVIATQNPIEMEGTYPLPEAQLDRFFFKLTAAVPTLDEMREIMTRTTGTATPTPTARFGADTVASMLALIRQVRIADGPTRFALRLVCATHPDDTHAPVSVREYVRYGASPRAAQAMILAAKARALVHGRYHVAFEDISDVALPALAHRIIRNLRGEMDQVTCERLARDVLAAIPAQA